MRTYLDCIPCFFKQALYTADCAGADEQTKKKIIDDVAKLIPHIPLGTPPPQTARIIYHIIRTHTNSIDPFGQLKKESNKRALDIYPFLKNTVKKSPDKLLTAIQIAIAGNIIDYGAKHSLDMEKELDNILNGSFAVANQDIFHYAQFKADLEKSQTILYLADNAGELVFDRILMEQISPTKNITVAVKDKPAINDALMADATQCGIHAIAEVISNGYDAPGTILKYCSDKFLSAFHNADMIISKGQGNFETLSDEKAPIYFLFKVKCPVVANHINAPVNSMVLKKS